MTNPRPTLAILGGTGKEGGGLALRWSKAGYKVILGSRSARKAVRAAEELNGLLGRKTIQGADNLSATEEAAIIVLTVPYPAQRPTADLVRAALGGKILIDVTVPLVPPKVGQVQLPADGSAVQSLQRHLGSDVRVVSAFQNVSAHRLMELSGTVECDVLVCSNDREAAAMTITLAKAAGLRGFYAGPLANSVAAEALTSVLITLNQRHKVSGAGIRITGVPE